MPSSACLARVWMAARSEPAAGSEKSWHQTSSALSIGPRWRCFCSSSPCAISVGPSMPTPMTSKMPGTPARPISWLTTTWWSGPRPWPPYSAGHMTAASPPSASLRCHSRRAATCRARRARSPRRAGRAPPPCARRARRAPWCGTRPARACRSGPRGCLRSCERECSEEGRYNVRDASPRRAGGRRRRARAPGARPRAACRRWPRPLPARPVSVVVPARDEAAAAAAVPGGAARRTRACRGDRGRRPLLRRHRGARALAGRAGGRGRGAAGRLGRQAVGAAAGARGGARRGRRLARRRHAAARRGWWARSTPRWPTPTG